MADIKSEYDTTNRKIRNAYNESILADNPLVDTIFGTAGDAIPEAMTRQEAINKQYQDAASGALSPYAELGNFGRLSQLQQDYLSNLTNMDTDQYKVTNPILDRSNPLANVQQYIDPNVAYQQEAATKALESTAAGKGGLFSSGLGKQVATTNEQLAAQAYNDAYNKALNEANRQNQLTQTGFSNQMQAGQYNFGLDQAGTGALGTAYNTVLDPFNTYSQGLFDIAGTQYGAETGLNQQALQAKAADKGIFGEVLGVVGSLYGGS